MPVVEIRHLFGGKIHQLNLRTDVEGELVQVADELVGFRRGDQDQIELLSDGSAGAAVVPAA